MKFNLNAEKNNNKKLKFNPRLEKKRIKKIKKRMADDLTIEGEVEELTIVDNAIFDSKTKLWDIDDLKNKQVITIKGTVKRIFVRDDVQLSFKGNVDSVRAGDGDITCKDGEITEAETSEGLIIQNATVSVFESNRRVQSIQFVIEGKVETIFGCDNNEVVVFGNIAKAETAVGDIVCGKKIHNSKRTSSEPSNNEGQPSRSRMMRGGSTLMAVIPYMDTGGVVQFMQAFQPSTPSRQNEKTENDK